NWSTDQWQYSANSNYGQKAVLCVIDNYEATSPKPTTIVSTTSIALNCPYLYHAMEGKCIRPLYLDQTFHIQADLPGARKECAKDGGHLPIIKSDDENAIINNIVQNNFEAIKGRFNFIIL
ncbi:hypothetical protein PENTCL1PPCAC_21053, partial [Pristionchus entomophagus]